MPAQSYEREHRGSQVADDDQPTPTLSVTVLNYNYAKYLPQCLDSILSQTWTDFELILINDCSTDNSLAVIEPYLADPRVRFVNHPKNQGYIFSLIEGSELSRGKYITVISADDYCVSDRAFETLLHLIEADAEVVYAYSAYGNYADDGIRIWVTRPNAESFVRPGVEQYRDLLALGNHILHSGVIIRATAYEVVGGYEPSARHACDTIMWMMLCGQGKVAYCTDELYAYRRHGSNMSVAASGVQATLREHVYGIRQSFAVMGGSPEISKALYLSALKGALSYRAIEYVFAGHLRLAWYTFWCAVRVDPLLTIFQIKTLSLISRTLLGSHGHHILRSLLRRDHGSIAAPA